jgi:hypothetical protein
MIVHRIAAVSLVALKSENLSIAGTGSYYILCIEYTLHYTVTSLVLSGCKWWHMTLAQYKIICWMASLKISPFCNSYLLFSISRGPLCLLSKCFSDEGAFHKWVLQPILFLQISIWQSWQCRETTPCISQKLQPHSPCRTKFCKIKLQTLCLMLAFRPFIYIN